MPFAALRPASSIASRTFGAGLAALGAIAPLLAPGEAGAHLSIVRQGPESRGALEFGDRHGAALAVGDFNGDGYDDLAMGAPAEDISGGFVDAGAVVVSFGSPTGLTHVGGLLLTESSLGATDETNAEFGFALAAADFDGDGLDDLAVGAPGATLSGVIFDVGEVHVLRGNKAAGLVPWRVLRQPDAGGSNEFNDRFGASLASGHLDGASAPAYADLVVGGPGEDSGAGAVFFFMGTASGPTGASGWYKQSSFGATSQSGDGFGSALAIGNLMGDAADDLAVGVPAKDVVGAAADAGRVFLIPGAIGSGLQSTALTYDASDAGGTQAGGQFGAALAAGWLRDANGYESLAIGEPGRGAVDILRAGRVVVFPGRGTGLDRFAETVVWGYAILGTFSTDDRFGTALAAAHYGPVDAYEDLAVGARHVTVEGLLDAGMVAVVNGAGAGPGAAGFTRWNQRATGDIYGFQNEFGASLAFGDFDGSGRGALAAGAPGEDRASGQVHVIAPWRQPQNLICGTSVVYDCAGSIVFSQKPFEQVFPASTTKIMTALLACERGQLPASHPDYRNLDAPYAVPAWVTNQVGGSQALHPGEVITLRNLLDLCMMRSANDAAYAIGDILAGNGQPSGIPAFAALMNTRAAQLGMTRTNFTNAAGLTYELVGPTPVGAHVTTAEDMAKLARAALNDPLFASLANTSYRLLTRHYGGDEVEYDCHNVINWVVSNPDFVRGNGVKSGSGNTSQWTTVTSAFGSAGTNVVASTFYTPRDLSSDLTHKNAIDLLVLGLGACGIQASYEPVPAWWSFLREGLPTALGARTAWGMDFGGAYEGDIAIDFSTAPEAPSTTARIGIRRMSDLVLTGGQDEVFGVTPFDDHEEIRIQNMGSATATFDAYLDYLPEGSAIHSFTLAPGEIGTIPAYGGPDAVEFRMSIENGGGEIGADLSIAEHYTYDATIAPGAGYFSVRMPRGPLSAGDVIEFDVTGTDPLPGRTIAALLREHGTVVGVDGPLPIDTGAARPIRFRSTVPNPLSAGAGAARLTFDLAEPGTVHGAVFDVRGRRVRALPAGVLMAGPQALAWDGRDDSGRRVPAGVYLVRLELAGRGSAGGRIVLLP